MIKPINLEIAKLLTSKNIKIPRKNMGNSFHWYKNGDDEWVLINCYTHTDEEYDAPTIVEVVMWLFEKHGIWINGGLYTHLGNVSKFQFTIQSQKSRSTNSIVQLNINPFNSPTEAYEAAIEYTLKNLL